MEERSITEERLPPLKGKPIDKNRLFPVFLKLENLEVLLVGGGKVGLEKLQAMLTNAPATPVTLVAAKIDPAIRNLAGLYPLIKLIERPFAPDDLKGKDLVVIAIDDKAASAGIRSLAKENKLLVNVADTPELCDFYLSSIVDKGNLKIAISTNGKSPTIAKRMKEQLADLIPDEIENVLQNMTIIREDLKGDFAEKVRQLDDLTSVLSAKQANLTQSKKSGTRKWPRIVFLCLFAFVFLLLGAYIPWKDVGEGLRSIATGLDKKTFALMALTGFLAQMVDGSLGMGYGTISTTFLLAIGVPPAIVSSRVHSARTFSSGVAGFSHHRFGNINKKLFQALVIPGVIGAILGAALAYVGQKFSSWIRIPLNFYTLYLGIYIVRKAFRKVNLQAKVRRVGWLAGIGGFMDAFAGGGWGSLVTGTLISKRRNPRYVIGSVCLAEFFVVFASSITFFILLKTIPILDVAGLIVGGLIAAPIAARLVGKLPMKGAFIAVGTLVIITSVFTLFKSISNL